MKPLLLALTLTASPLLGAEQTVTFDVPGMYCASCPYIVQSAMGAVEGVLEVTADSDTRTARVTYEDTLTNIGSIAAASAAAGYEATLIEAGS